MQKDNYKIIIGIIIIFIGIIISIIPIFYHKRQNLTKKKYINNYINTTKQGKDKKKNKLKEEIESYSMILKIPSIGLEKGIYSINSKYNNLDYGIELMKESNMPNIENGNLIISGHNGNSKISYFNTLSKMSIGDYIYIYYSGIKYKYVYTEKYEEEKDGDISIIRDNRKTSLILITCKENTDNKQIVYVSYLDNKTQY